MNSKPLCTAIVLMGMVVGYGWGCASRHLTPSHGRANHRAFRAQIAHPAAGRNPKADFGLDAEEASVISQSHVDSLKPEGSEKGPQQPVLIVAPSGK